MITIPGNLCLEKKLGSTTHTTRVMDVLPWFVETPVWFNDLIAQMRQLRRRVKWPTWELSIVRSRLEQSPQSSTLPGQCFSYKHH